MPLEVIGAGFGRTGTKSLKRALEMLGYNKCHHMVEVMKSKEQIQHWDRVSKGEDVNWDEVFEKFHASVDWPSAHFYKELADHFPDAKVVLGIRNPDVWYKSTSETIYLVSNAAPNWIKTLVPSTRIFYNMINRIIWDGRFEGRFEDRDFAVQIFEDHIEAVKSSIPPERLLIHQPQDGWEPLCEFLGKPIPDSPYPYLNEAREIKFSIVILKFMGYLPWLILALILGIRSMTLIW